MPVGPGETLYNRYRIVKLLGMGGFGAVYRAWDLNLQRPCAIKENLESAAESQEQFQREARMLSNLTHSNLPRVTDYFIVADQGQYLVMDFIDGQDLQEKIDQPGRPLPEDQVLHWIEQVSDALKYLHSQNPPIIHRDIKPQNIIINPEGKAFLVDFGIAKIFDATKHTTIGARAVTPGYSPVEQYGHGKTDARSDIYALGATQYTLLTAQTPVESVIRNETPLTAPRTINPKISSKVEKTVLKAMELAPSNRYQTMHEYSDAITACQKTKVDATALVSPPVAATSAASIAPPPPYPQAGVASAAGVAQPAPKQRNWRAAGIIGFLLILAAIVTVFIILFVANNNSKPVIAFLSASDTPSPTATFTQAPTSTFTYTPSSTPTRTYTPRPTSTTAPTNTPFPANTSKPATATRKPTSTPAPTKTKTPTPTSSDIVLLEPTKDTRQIYQGGTSCGPNEVKFSISATGPVTDHLMFIFWNVQDKATGSSIGWNSGQLMTKVRGESTWTYTFNANTMINTIPYQESWFLHQFVLQERGGSNQKWRSGTYSDITLSRCP